MGKLSTLDRLQEEQHTRDEAWESKQGASAHEVAQSSNTCLRIPDGDGRVSRTYRWCLELPVPCVLGLCWLVGAALIGVGVWALYLLWSLLIVLAGV